MSEFEREDDQVMGVVNDHANPEAAEQADRIATQYAAAQSGLGQTEKQTQEDYRRKREEAMKRFSEKHLSEEKVKAFCCVGVCAVVAAMFGIALALPKFVVWLVNLGILSCGITAGIAVYRYIEQRKVWRG